ncbi:MAG: glycosyltransferase family 4 protein [Deltaproteobacteria bacterium]|nr:MAG: glycosyltransferase family 4 protein [Deltaproteobacteria bacterium]
MRIAFYAPFKPLGHPHPSGDLTIGTDLFRYLETRGNRLVIPSRFRSRWIYWRPWYWPGVIQARKRSVRVSRQAKSQVWLTYHAYYKAPDLLGPYCCRRLNAPFVIFQGIYSTKRRRHWKTWPGFILNRMTLLAADHVLTNRKVDLVNLKRLLPDRRFSYVVPGIQTGKFRFDPESRREERQKWGVRKGPVLLTAAMFRPGVKTDGLAWVIRTCAELHSKNYPLNLVIAGAGQEGPKLRRLADQLLPERVSFIGQLPREKMYRFYSAGDVFVFPGIRESLGMVYLEAQSCGLPVVAFADGGIPEVVAHNVSGYLVRPFDAREFTNNVARLLTDPALRRRMGEAASDYVQTRHELERNYREVEIILRELVEKRSRVGGESRY